MIFFKTPEFWYRKPSVFQKIVLRPISYIYSRVATRNYWKSYAYEARKAKVIAIGGITMGGSGKTIVVHSICEALKSKNKKVAVLSRGFGRLSKKTLLVDSGIHSCKDVGDEPLLLSNVAPVYVGKDRSKSAKLAETEDFDFLVLDNGITQKFLKPNIKLVVIDGEQRFGNGEMFPLGPNYLNFKEIKSDIDGIIVLNKHPQIKCLENEGIPLLYGKLQPDFSQIKGRVVAFCGIGYPNKFFNSLADFAIVEKIAFPDHYPFSDADIEKLIFKAERWKAQLVTTEKDFMRISEKYRCIISIVPVKIVWEAPIIDFLKNLAIEI
ncbi:MAG: tetraacyldisaccharide 4'-kinase [Holosporaceae bacterium]|jgi:tetraacyldisaccharide 4'-kinase|nr:tetraacyldisaccharide 4'-kinase [Holosporaceae bacterium]